MPVKSRKEPEPKPKPKPKPKPTPKPRTAYTFPWLHQDVANAVSDEVDCTWVSTRSNHKNSTNEYSTNVMGKFTCNNDDCTAQGWGSKKVSILIRGYPGDSYNAVVFNQRCESCNQLGDLTLDKKSYVERVAYRLKKWAGIQMEPPRYSGKSGLPHKTELCEGCKKGYCHYM